MKYFIYLIARDDDELYVGVTKDLQRRMSDHRAGRGSSELKNRDFDFIVLEEGSEDYIYNLEDYYINKYKCSLNKIRGGTGGGGVQGQANSNSLFTDKQVIEILDGYFIDGVKQVDLAKRFGTTKSTISKIVTGKNWAHIDRSKYKPRPKRVATQKILNKIVEMRNSGQTYRHISKELGICVDTVSKYYKEAIKQ